MSRRVLGLLLAVLVVLGCAGMAWFLLRQQHVDRAGAWAGIIGLAGLPLAVWAIWLALHPPPVAEQPKVQTNQASTGGTVYAVQDGNQTVHHHPTQDVGDGGGPPT
jgi:hypothetical protein